MIEGILFDKDGTLFDFHLSWGGWAQAFLRSTAKDEAEATRLGAAIGYDLIAGRFEADSLVIAGTAAEIAARLMPHLPGQSREEILRKINAAAASAQMVPAVALRPLLEQLRAAGVKIGLATNDTEAPARAHLAAHDLTDLFDFIAGYDSGHGAKPGPGMCLAFAEATGLSPADIAMVGDSLHDLHAGRAAGMVTVGVLTGMAGAETLGPHADVIFADIGHLPSWIASQRA